MKNLQKTILEKIRKKHLKPRPKWSFAVKNYIVWGAAAAAIVIGSLAAAVAVFMIRYNDWELLPYLRDNKLSYIFASLPYFWLIALFVLLAAAFYNFKHTKRGYRYPIIAVAAVSIGASVFLGVLFHCIGWGQAIDSQLVSKVPLYREHLDQRCRLWSRSDSGFLAGTISALENEKIFTLRAVDGHEWQVRYSEARIISPRELEKDMAVKIIGEREAEMIMRAELIKAMLGSGPRWLMPCQIKPARQGRAINIRD